MMQLYSKILIGMAVGIVLGVFLGPNSFLLPSDGVEILPGSEIRAQPEAPGVAPLSAGVTQAVVVPDGQSREGWVQVQWKLTASQLLKLRTAGEVDAQVTAGQTFRGWVPDSSAQIRRFSLLGTTLVNSVEWIGELFLRLIKMVVVPLVFFSLLVGVASIGDFRRLGRMGGATLGFFMTTTVMALAIGVGLANLVAPGRMLSAGDRAALLASYGGAARSTVKDAADAPGMVDRLLAIIPENPVAALASGDMLQIIFFALMLGMALTFMDSRRSRQVVALMDKLNEAVVMLVHFAMKLAPYGVAALLFKVVGSVGMSVLVALLFYSVVVLAGLLLHVTVVYSSVVRFGARLPVRGFLRAMRPALMLAFSTSSSAATLPVTKECTEDGLGVSPQVSSFVLPLGATINMDGTALYQGVAAIFIAQIYNMDLTLVQQATIILSATLASIGAAGVPGAGMVTLAMVLSQVGVPTEGLALVLGVDRLLDMFRTVTNVIGDSTATALMARLEGNNLRILTPEEDASDPEHGFERRLEGGPHPVPPDEDDEQKISA